MATTVQISRAANCRRALPRWSHGDRGAAGEQLRRPGDDGRSEAARRERLLVPELSPPLEGERAAPGGRARGARAAVGGAGPATRSARLRGGGGGRVGRGPS